MSQSLRCLVAVAALAGGSAPALAQDTDPPADLTVNANAALVTDYRFRGLSRSTGGVAVQGGIDIDHINGLYSGLWASSLAHGIAGPLSNPVHGEMQLDLYGGWRGSLLDGWVADVGLLYSAFPDGDVGTSDYFEPYASLSTTLGPARARVGVKYAWRQQALNFNGAGKDDNLYVHFDLDAGIPGTPLSIAGGIGYTDGALSPKFATGQTLDYAGGFDWNMGVTYALTPNLLLGGRYVGVAGRSIGGYSDDTVIGTLKLSF